MTRTIVKDSQKNTYTRKVTNQFIKNMLKIKSNASKKKIKQIKKQQLKTILKQEMMNCPLCLQIMVLPTVTECGHNYCLKCIQQYFYNCSLNKQNPRCSMCRTHLQFYDYHQSSSLKVVIDQYLQKLNQDESKVYLERESQAIKDDAERMFRELQAGQGIDYFDVNIGQWRYGIIISVFFNQQAIQIVTIRGLDVTGRDFIYIRFPVNSKKIASLHYFTKQYHEEDQQISYS